MMVKRSGYTPNEKQLLIRVVKPPHNSADTSKSDRVSLVIVGRKK